MVKKKSKREKFYIAFLLIALIFAGFLVASAFDFLTGGNNFSEFTGKGNDVILSLRDQASSIIDNISGGSSGNNNNENTNNTGGSGSSGGSGNNGNNVIIERIVLPTQEIIVNTKDNTVDRVEYIRQEIEKIVESITNPINETTNSLAKQLIGWLLSLLTPGEIREIFQNEFGVDICL